MKIHATPRSPNQVDDAIRHGRYTEFVVLTTRPGVLISNVTDLWAMDLPIATVIIVEGKSWTHYRTVGQLMRIFGRTVEIA